MIAASETPPYLYSACEINKAIIDHALKAHLATSAEANADSGQSNCSAARMDEYRITPTQSTSKHERVVRCRIRDRHGCSFGEGPGRRHVPQQVGRRRNCGRDRVLRDAHHPPLASRYLLTHQALAETRSLGASTNPRQVDLSALEVRVKCASDELFGDGKSDDCIDIRFVLLRAANGTVSSYG